MHGECATHGLCLAEHGGSSLAIGRLHERRRLGASSSRKTDQQVRYRHNNVNRTIGMTEKSSVVD